jgi:beta-phosphoglucomutase family hydrolase
MAAAGIERVTASAVGLPAGTRACLFDLDGVLTDTARLHAAAWKEMFDSFLRRRAGSGGAFVPFAAIDYDEHVDGRPRYDGVCAFLASRGIELPRGGPTDEPGTETICGLGNAKNELVLGMIHAVGAKPYPGSVRYVRAARRAGLRCGVVSSSANCGELLASAGIDSLFDVRIDGLEAERRKLRGKPAPDTFLAGAEALDATPGRTAVFEDAIAGVDAAHAGNFGFVVGVDRSGQSQSLLEHGADVVVPDLEELLESP